MLNRPSPSVTALFIRSIRAGLAASTLTPGNTPKNFLRGPSQRRLDMSFFKNINMAAGRKVQLRWEIFNVTNTVNFTNPNGSFGSLAFATITSTGNSIARQMQFAARFTF